MYEQIIEKISKYLKEDEVKLFEKCYKSATKEYANKVFLEKINTLEYINNVVLYLTKYNVAIESLLACLLLKTDNINYSYVTNEYGEDTSTMLEALVRIDNVNTIVKKGTLVVKITDNRIISIVKGDCRIICYFVGVLWNHFYAI